jgi:hypothetical protein
MGFGAEGERGVLNRYLNNRLIVTEGFGPSFFCSCGGMIGCLAMLGIGVACFQANRYQKLISDRVSFRAVVIISSWV